MDAIKLIRIALLTLTDRLLTIFALVMTFALACWTMDAPTWERMGMTAFFAVSVFLPCVYRERNQNVEDSEKQASN